jgi:hypothetical protein
MSTNPQIAANQANALLSTGPNTEDGKAVSSKNGLDHGLAGAFCVLPWEDQRAYITFCARLGAELRPVGQWEGDLFESMVQHRWLANRAILLQERCFASDDMDCLQEKKLALYLRYQTTHERAYYKAMREFQKLREQKRKTEIGFASQKRQAERKAHEDERNAREEQHEIRRQERHQLHKKRAELANFFAEAEIQEKLISNIAGYCSEIAKDPAKDAKFRELHALYGLTAA